MTPPEWKAIEDLHEPYNDALNYRSRSEKELFNKIFVRTDELRQCLSPSKYFLMGEKGTGKTAYAVYLENNAIDDYRCQITTMTESQYKRFVELKRRGQLNYSDYANIWRSMLLFLVAQMLVTKSKDVFSTLTGKFSKIEREIGQWSKNALNPEVESAFEAVTSDSFGASFGKKDTAAVSGEMKTQETERMPRVRHHLLETENALKEAISQLRLSQGHILFVDGIDFRPESVHYPDYLQCVKGLGEAVWQLNTEFFNAIRDSRGRIKVVLLVRPDVFNALNLYNSNSRLQDNTVFLDWSTNQNEFQKSHLYELSGKYFSTQQDFDVSPSAAWEHYYDEPLNEPATFKRLLRTTFQKPRDILTFIKFCRDMRIQDRHGEETVIPKEVHRSAAFTRRFSDYLLGEVRNYAAFYMTQDDFTKYLKFFQFLDGRPQLTMTEFERAFEQFKRWAAGEKFDAKEYLRDGEALLQFLYDVNVIGYSETTEDKAEQYFHWSYRERSMNNIAPKVKTAGQLLLNRGIAKALDIGKSFRHADSDSNASSPSKTAPRRRKRGRRPTGRPVPKT